jgi:hypothetical protein
MKDLTERRAEIERQKLVADAILLERAARVLDRTSRKPFDFSAGHWLSVKQTLNEVAAAKRQEAERG